MTRRGACKADVRHSGSSGSPLCDKRHTTETRQGHCAAVHLISRGHLHIIAARCPDQVYGWRWWAELIATHTCRRYLTCRSTWCCFIYGQFSQLYVGLFDLLTKGVVKLERYLKCFFYLVRYCERRVKLTRVLSQHIANNGHCTIDGGKLTL